MKVAQAPKILAGASSFVAPVLRAVSQKPSAAEQIPRPYSRAEESAREVNGDFGMTEPLRLRTAYMRLSTRVNQGRWPAKVVDPETTYKTAHVTFDCGKWVIGRVCDKRNLPPISGARGSRRTFCFPFSKFPPKRP
jgi:hypothetical protein